jgi:lysyl-tRNA synthetase class 1
MAEPNPKLVVPVWAQDVLSKFENQATPYHEVEVAEALGAARKPQGDLNPDDWKGFLSEWSAFMLDGMHDRESVWGTHFGPMMSAKMEDGGDFYSPDIKKLNADSVAHWEARAKNCAHPVMRARYADLVWDLKRAIAVEKGNIEFARIAIASYLEAAEKKYYSMEMFGIQWLRRALSLSLSINDAERTKRIIEFMFEFYDRVEQLPLPGTWLFLFDSLYGTKGVTAEQEARIIANLESKLAKVSDTKPNDAGVYETLDPWTAESVAERLAQHYRSKNDKPNVERVIRTYGKAFEQMARGANPMLATAWLQPVIERYEQAGLKQEAENLQILAGEKGKNISSDLKTVSVESDVKAEDVEKLVEQLIGSGNLRTSLGHIAHYFLPKVDDTRKLLERLRSDAPFLSIVPLHIIEKDGFTTAKIGSIEDDFDGRLHHQLGQTIGFYMPFLEYTLGKLRERYAPTVDDILCFLCESPLFADAKDGLLRDGLEAYQQDDFVKAVHVLVPQVEYIVRHFAGRLGIPTRKTVKNRPGITDAKNMNDVLADDRIKQTLTENLWRYLAVVYSDRRGLNIRNNMAHGLVLRAAFGRRMGDLVFHTLLALSLMRASEKKPEGA